MTALGPVTVVSHVERPTSTVLAKDRLLPATPMLAELLPAGGLQRGSTVVVSSGSIVVGSGGRAAGTTTLAVELLAGASLAGQWCAVVGLPQLGVVAAAEHQVRLDRLLLVPSPGPPGKWQQVVAAMLDGVSVVVLAPPVPVRSSDARKLTARAMQRDAVLVVLDPNGYWSERADLRCAVVSSAWSGLGQGCGLLSNQVIELEITGRGAAVRPRRGAISLLGSQLDLAGQDRTDLAGQDRADLAGQDRADLGTAVLSA